MHPFPLLTGFLVDITDNYGAAFYSCALGMGLGAVFLGLVRPSKKWLPCRRRILHCPAGNNERNPCFKEENEEESLNKRTPNAHICSKSEDKQYISQEGATRDTREVIACY